MKFDNIFFLENFFGIRNFLSIYNYNDQNLIVMSEDKSLVPFIHKILPSVTKIVVPRVPRSYLPHETIFDEQIKEVVNWKMRYSGIFNSIDRSTKAYFFSFSGTLHFYIMLSELLEKNVLINYIHPDINFPFEELTSLPESYHLHLEKLSKIIGFRIRPFKIWTPVYLGLKDFSKYTLQFAPESWVFISEKIKWDNPNKSGNAVLLVDTPLHNNSPIGVNVKQTQQNYIKILSILEERGFDLHLKPHYDDRFEHISLYGTSFEKKVKILSKNFPVELILHYYPEIYTMSGISAVLVAPVKGKRYSLFNHVSYYKAEDREFSIKVFQELTKDRKCVLLGNGLIEVIDN